MSEDNQIRTTRTWFGRNRLAGLFFLAVFSLMVLWTLGSEEAQDEGTNPVAAAHQELTAEDLFSNSYFLHENGRASLSTDPCIGCHEGSNVLPGVTEDWKRSKHREMNVSCIDCHTAKPSDPDAMSHNGYTISPVVSPLDCARCHGQVVAENNQSLHAFGSIYYEFLYDKKALPYLESQAHGAFIEYQGEDQLHAATVQGCQGCHGTNMTGKSVDDFDVWPNNGIGRINPDGSLGSCASCHTRHAFSLEEARKPETCGQCHLGPDHPQIEIYMESKHGSIYASEGHTWNWSNSDWTAGKDYRAPTCASCHMSAAPGVNATHDVSSRLSWELEPALSRRTDNIANSLGVPFSDGSTWQTKQARMKAVCEQCHGSTWVDNFYDQGDVVIELYNAQYNASKEVIDGLRDDGLLTPQNFDEEIEFVIYEMWHHEGRRARMGAFMGGPDYVQWHGFYDLLADKVEIEEMAAQIRLAANASGEEIPDTYVLVFLASNGFDGKVYLQWDFDGSTEAAGYDLYWSTSAITDVSGLTPQAEDVTASTYVATGLTEDTTYYFAVVAKDDQGESTDTAYSSAVPTKLEAQTVPDDDDDDDEDSNAPMFITVFLLIVAIAALQVSYRRGERQD